MRSLSIYILVLVCSFTICSAQLISTSHRTSSFDLFEERFESGTPLWVSSNTDLSIVPGTADGNAAGKILEARYRPASNGSPRLTNTFTFNTVNEATLSFDFKLSDNFEFVKGGKMHGLAGGTATTGCKSIDPRGWSVRMMWRREGVFEIYVYHQDRQNRCGDSYTVPDFTLSQGTWYHVDLLVRINSATDAADGAATLYIGGEEMLTVNNLRLTGDASVAINKFQFSTFYGGSDSSWAPSTTTKIFYNNFIVYTDNSPAPIPQASLSPSTSLCVGGVLSPDRRYCCLAPCGSCGGSGCSGRPGGASNCCTSNISGSGRVCGIDGADEPPCKILEAGTTSSPITPISPTTEAPVPSPVLVPTTTTAPLPTTNAPVPSPVLVPTSPTTQYCCSKNLLNCEPDSDWCAQSIENCAKCNAQWIEKNPLCSIPLWGHCFNDRNGCCPPATCYDHGTWAQCEIIPTAPVVSTPMPVVPSTPAPLAITPTPISSTPAPVSSTPTPVAQTPAPVSSTAAPAPLTIAPIASTPAPVPSTSAPIASTSAPVVSPTSNCACSAEMAKMKSEMADMKSEMETLKTSLEDLINGLQTLAPATSTPAPVAATPAPFVCADRADRWEINGKTKNWCRWADKQANTSDKCKDRNLNDDCPVTCGVCTP